MSKIDKSKKNSCECSVGILSWCDRDMSIKEVLDQCKVGIPVDPLAVFDKRKGYFHFFSYCPYCGDKINWTKIRKELKESDGTH